MNVLSLFDGISTGLVVLKSLGIKVDSYFASEVKEEAIVVSKANHPEIIHLGDINNIKSVDLPKIDLIIGGSPCQDFSGANRNRKGLKGSKSGLFYEYVRLLEECKPKYFFLENVKMKKDQEDIISDILGVSPLNINSKLFTAQLRNRFYWTNIPHNINIPKESDSLANILESGYTERLKSRALLESDSRPLTTPVKMFHRHYAKGFTTLIFKNEQHYLDCKSHYNENFKGLPGSEITTDVDIYDGVRYLSTVELERLQGMPEGYCNSVSRNDAAGLLGDGWTVPVIKELFKELVEMGKVELNLKKTKAQS